MNESISDWKRFIVMAGRSCPRRPIFAITLTYSTARSSQRPNLTENLPQDQDEVFCCSPCLGCGLCRCWATLEWKERHGKYRKYARWREIWFDVRQYWFYIWSFSIFEQKDEDVVRIKILCHYLWRGARRNTQMPSLSSDQFAHFFITLLIQYFMANEDYQKHYLVS